ncbi:unnamed protein product [Onchocerca ochengi]|uniref:Uncharacterized protein n=1 Tax=Onchocerca ochengi TaxID=42157 RepID=A0A182DXZ5_ONCOC|nr:unnamed protein product [Onchocerca ochengi]
MNDRISPGCASIHADVKRDERACSHPLHLSPPSMTNHRLERDTSGSVSRCWVRSPLITNHSCMRNRPTTRRYLSMFCISNDWGRCAAAAATAAVIFELSSFALTLFFSNFFQDKNNWSDVSREEVQVQFYIFFVFSPTKQDENRLVKPFSSTLTQPGLYSEFTSAGQLEEEQSGGHIFGSDKKKKEGPHNFAEKDANLPFFKLHSRKKLLSEYNIAQCLPKADNFEVSEKDLVGNRR